MTHPPAVLSVAGSDPSGGAGIQLDLKVIAEHGLYGMAAITAITVQDTRGVHSVHPLPAALVLRQVEAVLADIPPAAVKVGMLGEARTAALLAELDRGGAPLVLDPVLRASSGAPLVAGDLDALRRLAAVAAVVTPNRAEAEALFGPGGAAGFAADRDVHVLVTGGDTPEGGEVVDVLHRPDGGRRAFRRPLVRTRNTHGTGCALSTAVACGLACGLDVEEAVATALDTVAALLRRSARHRLGRGRGPLLAGVATAQLPPPAPSRSR